MGVEAEESLSGIVEGRLLGGRLRYLQYSTGHRSGFEPVLLAASVAAKPGERVLEAGAGAGAALLCLAARVPGLAGTGLEIVPNLARLANENFRINDMSGFSCVQGDIGQWRCEIGFDHVMANPPWYSASATRSPNAARALARHASPAVLEGWVAGLSRCVKPRGSLTLVLPAALLAAAGALLRQYRCGAMQLFPLWPRENQPAKLMLLSARLGAAGPDRILPGLVLHGPAGLSAAAQAILRDGAPTELAI